MEDEQLTTIANNYFLGKNGYEKDVEKALKYYQMAATEGDAQSCKTLAGLYSKDEFGIQKDLKKSLEFNRMGAELGEISCLKKMGYLYNNGAG